MAKHTRSRQTGMTLIEVLVSMLILSLVIIAFLGFVDTFAARAKTQGNIADTTENLRYSVAALVRILRMAGTGGLPMVYPSDALSPPTLSELSIEVINNNTDGSLTVGGRSPILHSDVVIVRGVISGELYDIDENSINLGANRITVPATSPCTLQPQDLQDNDNEEGKPILIALQSPLDINTTYGGMRPYSNYRMVFAAAGDEAVTINAAGDMVINYLVSGNDAITDLNPTGTYLPFAPALAYSVGFLDELTFFIALNDFGEPSLYRFVTGALRADELIPNISNLQVALGCDTNLNGSVDPGEWFYEVAGTPAPTPDALASLAEVRLSVVARSQDKDIDKLQIMEQELPVYLPEDSIINVFDQFDPLEWFMYRYRAVTVRIALRSHPPMITPMF